MIFQQLVLESIKSNRIILWYIICSSVGLPNSVSNLSSEMDQSVSLIQSRLLTICLNCLACVRPFARWQEAAHRGLVSYFNEMYEISGLETKAADELGEIKEGEGKWLKKGRETPIKLSKLSTNNYANYWSSWVNTVEIKY